MRTMPTAFDVWKRELLESAGSAHAAVCQLGDYVLELFWKDGCEPTMCALLDYAQSGLCGHFNIRVADEIHHSSVGTTVPALR
jgi:hypothetical protein